MPITDFERKVQDAMDIAERDLCTGLVSRACAVIDNVILQDGRDAQVQLVIETDEGEWIAE